MRVAWFACLDNDGDPDGDIVGIVDWFGADGLDISEVPGVGFSVTATASAQPRTSSATGSRTARPTGPRHVNVSASKGAGGLSAGGSSDTVDVRPGQTTEIQVLRNDYDPEGKLLNLVGPNLRLGEGLVRIPPDRQVLCSSSTRNSGSVSLRLRSGRSGRQPGAAVVNVRIVDGDPANRAPVAAPTSPGHPRRLRSTFRSG